MFARVFRIISRPRFCIKWVSRTIGGSNQGVLKLLFFAKNSHTEALSWGHARRWPLQINKNVLKNTRRPGEHPPFTRASLKSMSLVKATAGHPEPSTRFNQSINWLTTSFGLLFFSMHLYSADWVTGSVWLWFIDRRRDLPIAGPWLRNEFALCPTMSMGCQNLTEQPEQPLYSSK